MADADSEARTAAETAAPEEPEAERRQLTVLFCDLVDSTELASRLDAEDWREVVRRFQRVCAEVFEGFEGHVAQHLGDGLLVYFSYPQAHEDDAERGVRAGLAVMDALGVLNPELEARHGLRLDVRIGLHTGPVVVGEMGGGASRETLAMGETANVAARIQGEAEPGTVVLSDATLRLVTGIFVTEPLGSRALRGVPAPVILHRAVQPAGVRSLFDIGRRTWTRFVGRDQELGLLIDRWEQAAEGEGQTILMSGEAGLGKSRLALALRDRVAEQRPIWLECRASPFTQGSALHPVSELVRQGTRIAPDNPPADKLQKLEAGVRNAGLDTESAVPLMADLLGIPLGDAYPAMRLSAELQRERTLDAFVAWALALGEIQPVLLLAEDLHWCDPSSLELFGRLIDQIPTGPILMVLTARPEFDVPWKNPKNWTPITLPRMRRRAARELALAVVGEQELPEDAVATILERADGVPLYLEELTRAALESGREGAPVAIPTTLHDSLMSRLDRVESAKEVASLASVIGRELSYALLEAVSDLDTAALRAGLARLVEADLMFQRGTPPSSTYTFKHALIQETAYDSLLRSRRQEIHERVVRALEEKFPERVAGEPETLARHCDAAGLKHEAIDHYRRAGEGATQRTAHHEAIRHLRRAIELVGSLSEGPDRDRQELMLQVALGPPLLSVRGTGDSEVERVWARARELCGEAVDSPELLAAVRGLVIHDSVTGSLERAAGFEKQLISLAERTDSAHPRTMAHSALAQVCFFLGRFQQSLDHAEKGVALHDPVDHGPLARITGNDEGSVCGSYAGWCYWILGRPDLGVESSGAAVETARKLEHPLTLAHTLMYAAVLHQLRGEREQSRRYAEEGLELTKELGFAMYHGIGIAMQAWSRTEAAETVEGIQRGLVELAGTGVRAGAPYFLGLLADAQIRAGSFEDALGAAKTALASQAEAFQPYWDAELHRLEGEAFLVLPEHGTEEAELEFQSALEIARNQNAQSFELRASMSLARLWRDQDKRTQAHDLLRPVYERFTEGFDTRDLEDAKALLEELA